MDLDGQVAALRAAIRDVPDFPKPGIVFKDITTLLRDAVLFRRSLDLMSVLCGDLAVDKVVAIESRGFILGGALALRLGAGFVPVRKPGKLPWKTRARELRARVRQRQPRDPRGRPRRRGACPDRRRRDRHRRHRARGRASSSPRSARRVASFAFLVELGFLERAGEARRGCEVRSLIRY